MILLLRIFLKEVIIYVDKDVGTKIFVTVLLIMIQY